MAVEGTHRQDKEGTAEARERKNHRDRMKATLGDSGYILNIILLLNRNNDGDANKY